MYIFLYLLNFFVDGMEIIGVLEIYCRFWRRWRFWVLRYLGEGDLVGFWKWGGFGVVMMVQEEVELMFWGREDMGLTSIAREVDCNIRGMRS